MRYCQRYIAAVLSAFLFSFSAVQATPLKKEARQAADSKIIKYAFTPGDVLVYSYVFETENRPEGIKDAVYHVRSEWQVELAVFGRSDGTSAIAAQYNLRRFEIQGRPALERIMGRDAARDLLAPYENVNPELVRYLVVDDLGNVQNHSYNLNLSASNVYSFMTHIARLPGIPLGSGASFQSQEEESMDVFYAGESRDVRGTYDLFEAEHPCGKALLSVNKNLGLPDRLEYSASYVAVNQVHREGYSLIFREKRTAGWPTLLKDPSLNKALVLAALARTDLVCDRDVIRAFLSSSDAERQNLAAAYCSLRGIPPGLDMASYLTADNPIVRFNAAKAMFKFQGEAGPLRNMTLDADPYLRRRSVNFFEHSTYMVPSRIHPLFASVQKWLFDGGSFPEVSINTVDELHEVLQFVKPANSGIFGCYKNFLEGAADFKHPYYLCLPEDYDPAEVYPLIIYLGMGDGRGDYALKSIADALRKAKKMSEYILLVPQAHGKWWEPEAEAALNGILRAVLQSISVNTNEICLAGSSNGGMATMFYGTHMPDMFAALASNMGYPAVDRTFMEKPPEFEPLKNLFNAKVFLSHGSDDELVTPEGDREASSFLRKNHVPVTYVEVPRKGHDVPIEDVLAKALKVFESQKRNPFPKHIDFLMNEPAYPSCYWIKILAYSALPAKVTAKIVGNTVEIETTGVREMKLSLDENMIDLSQPLLVRVNNKDVFQGVLHPSASGILWSAKERMDAQLAYCVSLDLDTF